MSWILENKNIEKLEDLPKEAFGFIYKINLNLEGKTFFYIGRKNFYSVRTRRISKRELNEKGKKAFRRKKDKTKGGFFYYELVKKESKWVSYESSSVEVAELIKKGASIKKEILFLVEEERSMTYQECKYQFIEEVLEKENSLNGNILGKFYKK